jgi:hypothetical protein
MSNGKYLDLGYELTANTTYWLAPGTHTFSTGEYDAIGPANGDSFIGAPGAILNGQGDNQFAFAGTSTGVTIKYLTVEDFVPPNGQGAVNHDSGSDWTVEYNTVQDNGNVRGSTDGAAMMMGSGNTYEYNCLTENGEYGLNAYAAGGLSDSTFSYNEVSFNGIADFPDTSCGCSGGVKFWASTNTTVEDNYIHDNYNVGMWYDTDNVGALVQDNYVARNWSNGLIYEISYNADINANTFIDNGWGIGSYPGPSGYPLGSAIYISASGGSSALDGGLYSTLTVSNNTLTDNWDGIIVYQNPNRLCGSSANSSTGYCTLANPSAFTTTSCTNNDNAGSPSSSPDYWDGCQWKANNVSVTGNTLNFDASDIINATDTLPDIINSDCYSGSNFLNTTEGPPNGNDYWCGFNGQFSLSGSGSGGSAKGWATADAIMGLGTTTGATPDHNTWTDNTYTGSWAFQAYAQNPGTVSTDVYPHGIATTLDFAGWQSTWGMDAGSTSR